MTKKLSLLFISMLVMGACSGSSPNGVDNNTPQSGISSSQDEITGESRKNCQRTAFGTCKCDWWRPWSCF